VAKTADSSLQALYHKAVAAKQTSVVIYGLSASSDAPLYAAFKKEFPAITVTGVAVVGPPMSAKLAAEFASGKHVGDIAYTGSTNMLSYEQSGWLVPFTPSTAPAASKLPPGTIGPKNTFYGTSEAIAGTIYNTSDLKASQVPTTWAAFTAPKWKNKLGMYDPTAVGEMAGVFAHLAKVPADADLMTKLHDQDVELYPATDVTGPLTSVAQGARPLGLEVSYEFYLIAKKAGAPVGFALLKADNYTTTLFQGQIKDAPDPIASRLYEDWMYTPPRRQRCSPARAPTPPSQALRRQQGYPPLPRFPRCPSFPSRGSPRPTTPPSPRRPTSGEAEKGRLTPAG